MRPDCYRRAGKSLVELLVALAIIALMLGLTLSALHGIFKAVQALVS